MAAGSGFAFFGDLQAQAYDENGNISKKIVNLRGVSIETTMKTTIEENIGHGLEDNGLVVGSFAKQEPSEFKMTLGRQTRASTEYLLLGKSTAFTDAGGIVASEDITLEYGEWIKTDHDNISNSAIVGSVLGVDFIEPEAGTIGKIMALSDGNLVDGATVSLAYTYAAVSGTETAAGTQPKFTIKATFDGENEETGEKVGFIIEKLDLASSATMSWITDGKYIFPELTGKLIKVPGKKLMVFRDGIVVG